MMEKRKREEGKMKERETFGIVGEEKYVRGEREKERERKRQKQTSVVIRTRKMTKLSGKFK